jgi:dTMP kinase
MFIVFEGGEGVGKSTQIELLYQTLKNKNIPSIKTREPGGTPFAEKIRSLFKEKNDDPPTPRTELYLICAARAQHVETIVKPHLAQKNIVLCDRFLDSTYVYQHILGKLSKQDIDQPTQSILQGLIPDLTFIFSCDSTVAMDRRKGEKNRHEDRLDSFDLNTHSIILNGYKKIAQENFAYPCGHIPKRILIDAAQNKETVFAQIKSALQQHLSVTL